MTHRHSTPALRRRDFLRLGVIVAGTYAVAKTGLALSHPKKPQVGS